MEVVVKVVYEVVVEVMLILVVKVRLMTISVHGEETTTMIPRPVKHFSREKKRVVKIA